MCYWVIPVSSFVLARTTVQHIAPLELQVPELQDQVIEFDVALRERLSDSNFVISGMKETSGFYLADIYDMEEFADMSLALLTEMRLNWSRIHLRSRDTTI